MVLAICLGLMLLGAAYGADVYTVMNYTRNPAGYPADDQILHFAIYASVGGRQTWSFPFITKAALHAFFTGAVLEQPQAIAPFSYNWIMLDEQPWMNSPEVDTLSKIGTLLAGKEPFPKVRAAVGGMRFTQGVGHLTSAWGVPNVGFLNGGSLKLEDKSEFPFFARFSDSPHDMVMAVFDVVLYLGYTRVNLWYGVGHEELNQVMAELCEQRDMDFNGILMGAGENVLFPPEPDSPRAVAWTAKVKLAKSFNAHLQIIMFCFSLPPFFDLMFFWASSSLTGRGYLWIGHGFATQTYHDVVYPLTAMLNSSYAMYAPWDGYIAVLPITQGPLGQSHFLPWWDSVFARRQEIFEPWMLELLPENPSSDVVGFFSYVFPLVQFDAVWAVMLAANSLLLEIGDSNFSGQQLLERITQTSFEGLSGRVEFNEQGQRSVPYIIQNYQRCFEESVSTEGRRASTLEMRSPPVQVDQPSMDACIRDSNCMARLLGALSGNASQSSNSSSQPPPLAKGSTSEGLSAMAAMIDFDVYPRYGVNVDVGSWTAGRLTMSVGAVRFHSCSEEPPPDLDLDCGAGYIYDRKGGECLSCPAGSFQSELQSTACHDCAPGRFAPSSATKTCLACPSGSFAALMGATSCRACAPGSFMNDVGGAVCAKCPRGQYREVEGSVLCAACPIGKYQSEVGQSKCEVCPPGLSTQSQSSTSRTECRCGAGTYKDGDVCSPCSEGLECVVGADKENFPDANGQTKGPFETHPYPLVAKGFYTTVAEPLAPYTCLKDGACPGGPPETCGGGRIGITCTACPAGLFLDDGKCVECTGSAGAGPLVLLLVAALIMLTGLHVATNCPPAQVSRPAMTGSFLLGMALHFALTVSTFSTLSAVFVPPISDLFSVVTFFSFDFEALGIACAFGSTSHIFRYLLKLLVFPVSFSLVVLGSYAISLVPKWNQLARFNPPALQNSAGFLTTLFFIPVGIASLEGFRCVANPNGKLTLFANTSLICWEGGEHTQIVLLSLFAILSCPVTFLALTFWMCYFYAALSQKYGVSFTARVRFLTSRVHPDWVLFSFGWYCRSFLISLFPVIAGGLYQLQVGLILAIFVCWLAVQTFFKCWRFQWINIADSIMGVAMILLLFGFALLGSARKGIEESTCGWYILSVAVVTLGVFIFIASYNFALRIQSKASYSVFITHHKAAAAMYARQIKVLFNFQGSSPPFLDVDSLDHLDCLSFAVKSSSMHMTVLTESVLERPWCAVEIASAHLNKVPGVTVHIDEKTVNLSDRYIEQVLSSFSSQDWAIISEAGITEGTLKSAFAHLAQLPTFVLPLRSANQELMDSCVRDILSAGAGTPKFRRSAYALDPARAVHIAYDTRDPLQCSAAYVAHQLFRKGSWDARLCRPTEGEDHHTFQGKGVGVIFLSKGFRTDPTALGAIVAMKRAGFGCVTALSQESFSKPEPKFFDALRNGHVLSQDDLARARRLAPDASLDDLASALLPLYSTLASGFGPEQNQRLMREEFKIMEHRAERELLNPMPSTMSSPPSQSASADAHEGSDDEEAVVDI